MDRYLEHKVTEFIKINRLINAGDKILLALSGGADSVFMLNYFNKFKDEFDIEIAALHVNHNLRGEESDGDELFCSNICQNLNIQFKVVSVNVKTFAKENSLSTEEAARELRYKALVQTAKQFNCNKIATAHNIDDNAETVLLNLFKGKGVSALSGIPVIRDNIIRPILSIGKEQILDYLNRNRIEYRIDSSNKNNIFQRNFIRNNIIPLIKENLNPKLEDAVFRNSEILRGVSEALDEILNRIEREFVTIKDNCAEIDLKVVEVYGTNTVIELVKRIFMREFKKEFHFSDKSLLLKLIGTQVGKKLELSSGIVVYRERDYINISNNAEDEFFEKRFKIGESIETPLGSLKIEESNLPTEFPAEKRNMEFASADELSDEFIIRNWTEGDKFFPLGMKGQKKISDFLTDSKIPSNLRKKQLVLINNNKIIWLVGHRLDNRFKIKENTKRVIKLWVN